MKTRFAFFIALLALPNLGTSSATGCGQEGIGNLAVELGGSADNTWYLLHDAYGDILVYEEANGIFTGGDIAHDLQRGGRSDLSGRDDGTCGLEWIPADLLLV